MEFLADAPLIFRIAGWPIESLTGLRSSSFAAEVDELVKSEAQIRDAADRLSQALHDHVPKILDKPARALVLRVRRGLFGTTSSLPPEELARLLAISSLPLTLVDQLVNDNTLRRAAEKKRETLKIQYPSVVAAERRYLFEIAREPRFLKALAVASPSSAAHWKRARRLRFRKGERATYCNDSWVSAASRGKGYPRTRSGPVLVWRTLIGSQRNRWRRIPSPSRSILSQISTSSSTLSKQ